MALSERAPADRSDALARADSIRAAIWLALATSAAGWLYALSVSDHSNRRLIVSLFGLWAVLALGVSVLSRDRIVAIRMREQLFVGWSMTSVGLTAAVVHADGGATSPLTLLFFLPVVYAALSYPAFSVVFVAVVDFLAYLAVGLTGSDSDPVGFTMFAFVLGAVAGLCVWQARNQEHRRVALARVSRADPLTGCLNVRGYDERLEAELSREARSGRPLGVVMLEMGSGHLGGFRQPADELLLWALEVMAEVLRPMDSVGRTGDLRFGVVVPGAGPDDTAAVARRLRDAIADRVPAAVGVACFPADGVDSDELQRFANRDLDIGTARMPADRRVGRRAFKELSWATSLARAVDERMSVQHEHSWRVSEYAVAVAQAMGWSQSDLEQLRMAAILHDVGKVAVPDHILRKRDPLSEREWEAVKKAPVRGAELVGRISGLEEIVPWVRHSHERYDGTGYPAGFTGEAIPMACRILHVADAFDAMVSGRPYRAAMTVDEALTELRIHAGTQFDPSCVALLEEHLELLA